MKDIFINGAREGNLKNITVRIPRNQLVVLTGLSGSGKSTLAMDVLYQECQRQYLEAMSYQGITKPEVDSVYHTSPAIQISQEDYHKNPRSTVGTLTDIYTDLRMVYEKLSIRKCPACGRLICSADCREELVKKADGFTVYMYCGCCGHKMEKLTRSHFSHNTAEGACETCQGLGTSLEINSAEVVHETLSLEKGAVDFWEKRYKAYQISVFNQACAHYGMPVPGRDTPVCAFTELQKNLLLNGVEDKMLKERLPDITPPKTVAEGRFEGVYPILWRRVSEKGALSEKNEKYFNTRICPECGGERLNTLSRSVTVNETRLPELSVLSLESLNSWITALESSLEGEKGRMTAPYLLDLKTKLRRIINVGLGYLTLDRQAMTLSGGEAQRIKLAAALDAEITGIIYILDEPTVGLHAKDTEGIIRVLQALRDQGNTVIVIEHDPDVIAAADHIIDMGPGAGMHGGMIVGQGTLAEIRNQPSSVTGQYLKNESPEINRSPRSFTEKMMVQDARLHNIKGIDVCFPINTLTAVTGVSGSGKSTLVFDILAEKGAGGTGQVSGLEKFDTVIKVEQSAIARMKRSNVATYSGAYDEIRKIFGNLEAAKRRGLTAKHFSFNSRGGRCENCEGLGRIVSNMLFFENVETVCPVCGGRQFNEEVLSVRFKGCSIHEILKQPVEKALETFGENKKLERILGLLQDVGLGYLELGQTLTTLSGGEGQRLKLARELMQNRGKRSLYLIDEPTTGLHPLDIEHFLVLLNHMVDNGGTVIVVEHNAQLIRQADWIIDLGPEGGDRGGKVIFEGTPAQIIKSGNTVTGAFLCPGSQSFTDC